VTADLRAGIEALISEPFIYRLDNGHTNIGTPPVVRVSDLDALLAAHPVQVTTGDTIRPALSTWLTLALDIRSGGPTVGDLLALRDWIDAGGDGEPPVLAGSPGNRARSDWRGVQVYKGRGRQNDAGGMTT